MYFKKVPPVSQLLPKAAKITTPFPGRVRNNLRGTILRIIAGEHSSYQEFGFKS